MLPYRRGVMESWVLTALVFVAMFLVSVFLLIPYSYKSFRDWVRDRKEKKLVISIEFGYLAFVFLSAFLVFFVRWVFYVD
jgi:uncharacterized membrane protein